MKRRFCRPNTGRFPELEAKLAAFFIEIRNLILPVTSETITQQVRVCFGRADMQDKLQSHQGLGIKIYQEGLFCAHRQRVAGLSFQEGNEPSSLLLLSVFTDAPWTPSCAATTEIFLYKAGARPPFLIAYVKTKGWELGGGSRGGSTARLRRRCSRSAMGRGGGVPIRPSTFSKGTLAWLVGSVLLALTALASRRKLAAHATPTALVFRINTPVSRIP